MIVENKKNTCTPKYWEIKSPKGIILKGINLERLVLENSHLFEAKDLNQLQINLKLIRGMAGL